MSTRVKQRHVGEIRLYFRRVEEFNQQIGKSDKIKSIWLKCFFLNTKSLAKRMPSKYQKGSTSLMELFQKPEEIDSRSR